MRFDKENTIVDEFLFCQEMKERTRAKNVFDLVNAFLCEDSIAWNKVRSVCTDDAPAMIGHPPTETSCSAYSIKSLCYS